MNRLITKSWFVRKRRQPDGRLIEEVSKPTKVCDQDPSVEAHKTKEIERSLCRRTSLRNQRPSTRNTYPLLSLPLAGVSRKAQSIPASADRTHFERFDLADQFVSCEARLKR